MKTTMRVRCTNCGSYQEAPEEMGRGGVCVHCGSPSLLWARRASDRMNLELEHWAKLDMVVRTLAGFGVALPRMLERVQASYDAVDGGDRG